MPEISNKEREREAREWAEAVLEDRPSVVGSWDAFSSHLQARVLPLLERATKAEQLVAECKAEHPPEPEYLAWPKERAELLAALERLTRHHARCSSTECAEVREAETVLRKHGRTL